MFGLWPNKPCFPPNIPLFLLLSQIFYVISFIFCNYSTADAEQLFRDAGRLNMTGSGYVWIVTEQGWIFL